MIPEIGNFALLLACGLALIQGVLPIAGSFRASRGWMAIGRGAARGHCLFVSLAFACLVHSFVVNDFSVTYVVANSNSLLPLQFRVAATWGGHEGSLLLWTEILALWTLAVTFFSRGLPQETVARVLGVMGLVSVGFLCFMLFTSDPFARTLPAASDGHDLNPLLQDFGMIVHPPLLYMGYVGFSVAFAFAIAALMGGQLDAAWARWSRPWTMVAWSFLTLGIGLGSFWAYYELGWGGWWFWDAVENASFMPWLVGTALIHSLAVTEKRGSFKSWTVLLAIMAFSLSLLGTFLVRSGVLTSVHAFATDPLRGVFILVFLGTVIGASLLLFAWRAPKVGLGGQFSLLSRESMLLANNVLLVAAAGTVFLGTLYPLLLDALDLGKISVGPAYFESVFAPLMLALLVLLAVGPFMRWKQTHLPELLASLAPIALASLLVAASLVLWSALSPMVVLGLTVAGWILMAMAWHLAQRLRQGAGRRRASLQPLSYWGMLLAHAGIGVFVVGVTLVKGTETSADVRMQLGDSAQAGGYTFRFASLNNVDGPNYSAVQAGFEVTRGVSHIASMKPEKRRYQAQDMPMTEAAIDRGLTRDLYLALGEQVNATTWIVRLQHKPFVGWIWGGCLLMAAGGLMAASDRRYRAAAARVAAGMPVGSAAAVAAGID
jgi:cytochrome c-type biogenesis protein CcmF